MGGWLLLYIIVMESLIYPNTMEQILACWTPKLSREIVLVPLADFPWLSVLSFSCYPFMIFRSWFPNQSSPTLPLLCKYAVWHVSSLHGQHPQVLVPRMRGSQHKHTQRMSLIAAFVFFDVHQGFRWVLSCCHCQSCPVSVSGFFDGEYWSDDWGYWAATYRAEGLP